MFNKPITHSPLRTIDDVKNFSYFTSASTPSVKKSFNVIDSTVCFSDESDHVYITPYRSEITSILEKAGFICSIDPWRIFEFHEENATSRYFWLKRIALEENWAETYEKAFRVSEKKGLKSVDTSFKKLHITEISPLVNYENSNVIPYFSPMISMFLDEDSEENIGTYILLNSKTVLVCDEYGRTFHVEAKKVIYDFVNDLIKAGYTRNNYPELYVLNASGYPEKFKFEY